MNQTTLTEQIKHAESLLSQVRAEEAKSLLIPLLNNVTHDGYIRYLLGVAYSMTGEHNRAIAQYDLALASQSLGDSDTANALSNKGVALEALEYADKALACYEDALALEPNLLRAAFNAGNACYKLKHFDRAELYFRTVVNGSPDNTQALMNLANSLFELGRYPEAADAYLKITRLETGYAPGYLHYGNALFKQGLFEQALTTCEKALSLFSEYPEALSLKACIFNETHRHQEALDISNTLITLAPAMPEGHFNLGEALLNLKKYDAAIEAFKQAITLKPEYPEAFFYLGCAMVKCLRPHEGELAYKQAIRFKPNLVEAHHKLGLLYADLNQTDAAINSLKNAIALKPDNAEILNHLGFILGLKKYFNESCKAYRQALELKPDSPWLKGDYLHLLMKMSDWNHQKRLCSEIHSALISDFSASAPFETMHFTRDPIQQRISAKLFSRLNYPEIQNQSPPIGHDVPIRVGYLSCDFREHAVTYLVTGLIESHDRQRFTIIAFDASTKTDTSIVGSRIRNAFDKIINIGHLHDELAADLIKQEQIDILIDLTGHTQGGRTGIFAQRAAPLQVSYLGHPGTMGAPYYDYIIADPTLVPESSRAGLSEKIIYLPECFQANDQQRKIIPVSSKSDFGLPSNQFVFASFNQTCKITPEIFAVWMSIMRAVPESILWLLGDTDVTKSNLRSEAEKAGINPERLVFATSLPYSEHLGRYALVDLVLDTFPFNGGTTTSDALWGSAPVITMAGEAYASRMAASLLHNLDLDELITYSLEVYEALAIQLASNTERLSAIRVKLTQNRSTAPVFNTERFTRHFENGLTAAVERCRNGLDPDHIYVERLPE